jgi:hypothetical protein
MFSALVTLDSQLAAVYGKFITALMVKEYHEKFVPRQLLLQLCLDLDECNGVIERTP